MTSRVWVKFQILTLVLITIFAVYAQGGTKKRNDRSIFRSEIVEERTSCKNVGLKQDSFCVTVEFSGGRLGNQLFELAAALSVAKDNHCIAVFPMFTETATWERMETYGYDPSKLFV